MAKLRHDYKFHIHKPGTDKALCGVPYRWVNPEGNRKDCETCFKKYEQLDPVDRLVVDMGGGKGE